MFLTLYLQACKTIRSNKRKITMNQYIRQKGNALRVGDQYSKQKNKER